MPAGWSERTDGDCKKQHYLGPESEQLSAWMREVAAARRRTAPDMARRGELAEMLVAGGAARESAAVTQVLAMLADAGIFRLRAALVSTQAFNCYANVLGVRFERAPSRTQDIDLPQERSVGIALAPEPIQLDMLGTLRKAEPGFFAVPELDPRSPSTSFKVRVRDLRVDLQAELLLEVLLADRPEEIRTDWAALQRRPRERSVVRRALVVGNDMEPPMRTRELLRLV